MIVPRRLKVHSEPYVNWPSPTPTFTRVIGPPSIYRRKNARIVSGSMVLVTIASIMRAPDSLSVQRLTTTLIASSVCSNGILERASTRFLMC
jgi:hypothetical protein